MNWHVGRRSTHQTQCDQHQRRRDGPVNVTQRREFFPIYGGFGGGRREHAHKERVKVGCNQRNGRFQVQDVTHKRDRRTERLDERNRRRGQEENVRDGKGGMDR